MKFGPPLVVLDLYYHADLTCGADFLFNWDNTSVNWYMIWLSEKHKNILLVCYWKGDWVCSFLLLFLHSTYLRYKMKKPMEMKKKWTNEETITWVLKVWGKVKFILEPIVPRYFPEDQKTFLSLFCALIFVNICLNKIDLLKNFVKHFLTTAEFNFGSILKN